MAILKGLPLRVPAKVGDMTEAWKVLAADSMLRDPRTGFLWLVNRHRHLVFRRSECT
jgi:hypothetical protein